MTSSSKKEPPCESPLDVGSNDRCVDGRWCNETCIAVIAFQECEETHHVSAHDLAQRDSCCKSMSEVTDARDPMRGVASANQQTSSRLQQSEICCDTKDSESVTSTEPSKDITDDVRIYEACPRHLAEAFKKYKAFLEAGICICRIALKQVDVCCSKTNRATVSKKRKVAPLSTSCCAGRDISNRSRLLTDGKTADVKNDCSAVGSNREICRSDSKSTSETIKSCNTARSGCRPGLKTGCGTKDPTDASYEPVVHEKITPMKSLGDPNTADSIDDVERSAAREHVSFSVTGMTCTGCAKKVLGVLSNVNGVTNAEVNFIAAIGGFDVDTTKISTPAALYRLEKETGFKCLRIASDHQTLAINMAPDNAQQFSVKLPKGVESVEKVGKEEYRVTYDPRLVGARKVLAASGGGLAPPNNDRTVSEGRRWMMLMLLSFFGSTIFTIPVCVLAFANLSVTSPTKGIVELVLATFVQLIAVPQFYMPALKALIFSRTIEMDMLVVISITAAYIYSVVAFGLETSGVALKQGPLFETSTLLITLVLLGRSVASYAKVRAVRAVSIRSLQAETAFLEDTEGNVTEIEGRLLEFNDIIRIPAHSKIVSDGEVVSGESAVDESMLTGEGLPIPKTTGDTVTAGTLNRTGVLRIRLSRLPGKNSITDIADLVQNALGSKPRVQELADIVAGYFVPAVVLISIVVFTIWMAVAIRIRHENAGGAIGTAITYTIAVLAVSCPCALGLAVPLVLVISGGVAAQGGVIIKQADAIERGYKVTDIVFDKTGTLTAGQLEVEQQLTEESSVPADQVLAIAYSLVKDDAHPVAQALTAKLKSQGILMESLEAVESIPGCGVQALWNGQRVQAGNPYWLNMDESPSVTALQAEGYTLLCVVVEQQLLVSFGLKAMIRPEAQAVINALQTGGLTCHIVSGDQPNTVLNVASSLGICPDNILSRQSPANKQTYIESLKSAGKIALFVGDGTNDAIAIAAANVGVQIGAASDVTRATADVVLLGGLEGVITLLEVSRQSFYRIVFNFLWSVVYNLFAILLASGAFVEIRIAPEYAGLGELVSVLPVVFAALTMLTVKTKSL